MDALVEASCLHAPDLEHLSSHEVALLLEQFPQWKLVEEGRAIARRFVFLSFQEMVTFVNGVFWVANDQQHHPHLEVGYDHCTVRWTTHALSGLSRNDFICAAKVEVLGDASAVG